MSFEWPYVASLFQYMFVYFLSVAARLLDHFQIFAVMKTFFHIDFSSHCGLSPLRADSWNPSAVIRVHGFSWPHSEGRVS